MQNRILTAGLELIKGNFEGAVKSLSVPLIPSEYRSEYRSNDMQLPDDPWWFFGLNGDTDIKFTCTNSADALKAYQQCSPLASIINRKMQADINGKRYIMDNKGKESQNDVANSVRKLMRRPNMLQNWSQFKAQMDVYISIFGFCPVFCNPPAGMNRYQANSMWNIPPNMLEITYTDGIPYNAKTINDFIKSVKFKWRNTTTEIALENIFFFQDLTPSLQMSVTARSRVSSLEVPVSNIIAAMNSRNTLIRRRGALGIISPKSKDGTGAISIPLKPNEKADLQREWRQYGTQSDQNNIVISNASIDWTRITMDVGELKLMEEVQDSAKMLCDGYGYPPHLLGLLDPTFNNQNAAEKGLYQNTIIPEAQANDDQWNEFFNLEAYRLKWVSDFSHLPIMQEDKKGSAEARRILGQEVRDEFFVNAIHYNRMLELLDEDTIPGMDKYYRELLAEGWQFGNISNSNNGNNASGQTAA